MHWRNFSVNAWAERDFVVSAGSAIREVVRAHRARGEKNATAISAAARDLGLSERRVRSYLYDEVFHVAAEEYARIQARFRAHLEVEARMLEARAMTVRARIATLRSAA
jgi:hypothetical protein